MYYTKKEYSSNGLCLFIMQLFPLLTKLGNLQLYSLHKHKERIKLAGCIETSMKIVSSTLDLLTQWIKCRYISATVFYKSIISLVNVIAQLCTCRHSGYEKTTRTSPISAFVYFCISSWFKRIFFELNYSNDQIIIFFTHNIIYIHINPCLICSHCLPVVYFILFIGALS